MKPNEKDSYSIIDDNVSAFFIQPSLFSFVLHKDKSSIKTFAQMEILI